MVNNTSSNDGVVLPTLTNGEKVVVRFQRDAGIRYTGREFASVARADVTPLNQCVSRHSISTVERLFSQTEDALTRDVQALEVSSGQSLPTLNGFFWLTVSNADEAEAICRELEAIDYVEQAYREPPAVPAIFEEPTDIITAEAPPATDDLNGAQGYLNPSPEGVDARYSWTVEGGLGGRVQIIDIEGAWNFGHEDLLHNQGGVVGGTPVSDIQWENHGTAVQGEIAGDENEYGILGIAPRAVFSAVSIFGIDNSPAKAIKTAADKLNPGDIILIELHRPGPNSTGSGQFGYIPIEWWEAEFAAVSYAAAKGVIVIAAAGNGSQNLDDNVYEGKFDRSVRDSGAILVGAGAPPSGNFGPDRSRLDFSNFGQSVDAQGWGREVTATGYGDLQGGTDKNKWYTSAFSGTSSASPIVVGAVACIQSIHRTNGCSALSFAEIRDVLRSTGAPQTDATGRPNTQRIGNRPDIKAAVAHLRSSGQANNPPPRPMVYANGKVFVNDEPAENGLILFARIEDYVTEHQPVLVDGGYDFLKVTPSDETHVGKTIKFYLRDSEGDEFEAKETDVFEEGRTKFNFNLHAEQKVDGGGDGDGNGGGGGTVVRSAEAEALSAAAEVVAGLASSGSVTDPDLLSTTTTRLFNDYLSLLKQTEDDTAVANRNAAKVRRFYEECVNEGNLSLTDEFFDATYISHSPDGDARYPYHPKHTITTLRRAFPDLQVIVEDQVSEGSMVVSRLLFRGTHKGQYQGVLATDRQVSWTGITMHRFSNGKIVETWRLNDTRGMVERLSTSPA